VDEREASDLEDVLEGLLALGVAMRKVTREGQESLHERIASSRVAVVRVAAKKRMVVARRAARTRSPGSGARFPSCGGPLDERRPGRQRPSTVSKEGEAPDALSELATERSVRADQCEHSTLAAQSVVRVQQRGDTTPVDGARRGEVHDHRRRAGDAGLAQTLEEPRGSRPVELAGHLDDERLVPRAAGHERSIGPGPGTDVWPRGVIPARVIIVAMQTHARRSHLIPPALGFRVGRAEQGRASSTVWRSYHWSPMISTRERFDQLSMRYLMR
jgi:hypothetical protein